MTADTTPPYSTSTPPGEHPAEAIVSLLNLEHNFRIIRAKIPSTCNVMGIVKANAYGHGAAGIAGRLEALGVGDFGVANIEEAVSLRKGQTISRRAAILAFCSPLPSYLPLYLKHDITATICDHEMLHEAESVGSAHNRQVRIQIKIDTGMGRLGVSPRQASELLQKAEKSPHLKLEGVYTHFAQSTRLDEFTAGQLKTFLEICSDFERTSGKHICKHAANSGALLCLENASLDMVRPGIMLYGYLPDKNIADAPELKPVMQLQAKVIFVKEIDAGTPISYNRKWRAPSKTRIATLSAGYADGYHRLLSNRVSVSINDQSFPQVGTVTMDQIMVDIGSSRSIRAGDDAILFGWSGPGADDIAGAAETISYEILCGIPARVRRIFKETAP